MSKNIKEIGKELLGKSLNSFHRKTGLTQLEKNNEIQDGILNGILSQVDDAYIEKTEQSNVIHLDSSDDGVVVLDSIKGNTMVNLLNKDKMKIGLSVMGSGENLIAYNNGFKITSSLHQTSNTYCFKFRFALDKSLNGRSFILSYDTDSEKIQSCIYNNTTSKIEYAYTKENPRSITLPNDGAERYIYFDIGNGGIGEVSQQTYIVDNIMFLSDYDINKEIPPYFEGLQSSFEEKVNDEGQYKFEILMKNKNLIPIEYKRYESYIYHSTYKAIKLDKLNPNETYKLSVKTKNGNLKNGEYICISPTINPNHASSLGLSYFMFVENGIPRSSMNFSPQNNGEYYLSFWYNEGITETTFNNMMNEIECIQLEKVTSNNKLEQPKHNKIKLLLNEPLRAIGDLKDRLCIRDGKLVIERNVGQITLDGSETWGGSKRYGIYTERHDMARLYDYTNGMICDKLQVLPSQAYSTLLGVTGYAKSQLYQGENWIYVMHPNLETTTDMRNWLSQNPLKIVYPLAEPTYEEVVNEYGEPILLEGYENGTLYIDSTITPTTTVRYTPKMESFNALKEVSNNNIMLTNDINNTIIPYMMEVDLMIMEKEVALMSQKNIRKIGAEDMTSMQKRTQQMLERLIKGKSLAEQECKTRVTTYLNANKITDEQAKELNFLIDEIYA